jgi:hypothetical protein
MHMGRMNGKDRASNMLMLAALEDGEHVHRVGRERRECLGGDQDCPLWVEQLERLNPPDKAN